jgi:hypothetical protein
MSNQQISLMSFDILSLRAKKTSLNLFKIIKKIRLCCICFSLKLIHFDKKYGILNTKGKEQSTRGRGLTTKRLWVTLEAKLAISFKKEKISQMGHTKFV